MDNLWQGILNGLKACKALGKIPATVGIDTWAVDFVLLDKDGAPVGDAVAYRDSRTEGADKLVEAEISPAELYTRTGIQKQNFNTICQLAALQKEHPEQLEAAHSLLMIPDYFHYRLTGVQKQEYTENKVLLWNDETQRKIECLEVLPTGSPDEEKIPMIIYIHGLNGNAESLVDEPEALAADKIAGFTFECGNSRIDGKTVTPAHYTSRVSDFETVITYVKTLPYVDPDCLYIYGQSYGGLVAMAAAPKHNYDTAGMILESTGLNEDGSLIRANDKPGLSQYELPEDWKTYIKQYGKDVIICCAEGDAGAYANGHYTAGVYEERDDGKATFISCPEGKHSFAAFSEEGKVATLNAIRELVLH